MVKLRIIGNMTGNSMDAIDLVLTEFDGEKMQDICCYSEPYTEAQKQKINALRNLVVSQKLTAEMLENDMEFLEIHYQYVEQIAQAIKTMCAQNQINLMSVDAIGFHGKTLDHNPPSQAQKNGTMPFTTQMGSAQLLADLTNVPVINDFRSALLMNGFEGAPLAGPHNAHISSQEGNGCYYNGGNTANLAWILEGKTLASWDIGPFNEYTDNFILHYKNQTIDTNAQYGKQGKLLPDLLQTIFDFGRDYYEQLPPKSGDPAYYHTSEIFTFIEEKYGNPQTNEQLFCDVIHTFEYFAGYLSAYSLAQTPEHIPFIPSIVLFGGGWKNEIARQTFEQLITSDNLYVLPEHYCHFAKVRCRFLEVPQIKYSSFGEYMEARLFADLARYYLEQKTWELPELENADKKLILGNLRSPFANSVNDCLSKASRGWQIRYKK